MISTCIVIPTYNENESLPYLISDLKLENHANCVVVICDDSDENERDSLKRIIDEINANLTRKQIYLNFGDLKGGRGAAVKRGLTFSLNEFNECDVFVECDADGSHTPEDIWRISSHDLGSEIVIGSRYLPSSQILNWPITRRFFSMLLNALIPRLFRLDITDVTNGLRRYNRKSVGIISTTPNLVSGFLYLTEQILILQRFGIKNISEISTTFVNRTRGESSVTSRDLLTSLNSLLILFKEFTWK
jgi:dolichol-phosphate mannosyltransferase